MNVENEFFYIEIEERKIFFYAQMTAFFFALDIYFPYVYQKLSKLCTHKHFFHI